MSGLLARLDLERHLHGTLGGIAPFVDDGATSRKHGALDSEEEDLAATHVDFAMEQKTVGDLVDCRGRQKASL